MTKNSCVRFLATVVCLVGLTSSVASAESSEDKNAFALSTSVGFFSDYMFRGFQNYDGTSIQPQATLSYDLGEEFGSLSGGVWAHLSAEGNRRAEKLTEVDYTVTYAVSVDDVTLKLGHIWYTYPDDRDGAFVDTKEVFGTIALNDANWNPVIALNPSLTVYHDYDFLDGGQYYEFGLSHTFEGGSEGRSWNLTPFVTFGFAGNSEKIYANNGLVQTTFGASTNLQMGDLIVTPSLNYTAEADNNLRNEFWFGTTIGWAL